MKIKGPVVKLLKKKKNFWENRLLILSVKCNILLLAELDNNFISLKMTGVLNVFIEKKTQINWSCKSHMLKNLYCFVDSWDYEICVDQSRPPETFIFIWYVD